MWLHWTIFPKIKDLMTIKTKNGMTLELPDNAEVQIDGDKITVKPFQFQPQISFLPNVWQYQPYYPQLPYQVVYGDPSSVTTFTGDNVSDYVGHFSGGTQTHKC